MSKLDGFKKYDESSNRASVGDPNEDEIVADIMADLPDMYARIAAGAQFFLCVIDATIEDKLTPQTGIHTFGSLASAGAWEAVHASFHEAANGGPDAHETADINVG